MALCLDEIVARLGGAVSGDGSISVTRIAPIEVAGVGDITFIANPKYQSKLAMTQASAVIIAPPLAGICTVAAIIHPEPYLYFARLAQWLNPPETVEPGIHPSATVLSALPRNVSVAAGAFIGENVVMGEGAIVGANAVVGNNSKLGAQTRLFPNATLYHGSVVGERCIIHSGVVIGADGFGFAREKTGAWVKIPQTGGVVIGNDVEVGANTTIDRGALADTVIEDGVKIDNQIQIGHNVRIGAHTVIAGCACVAGSTIIGKRCTIGGAAMIAGHLKIADDVTVSGGTVIAKNLSAVGVYTSNVPSMEHGVWLKNFAHLRHLDKMTDKIRALEARLNDLENKK